MHLSPMGAASTQPSFSSFSRWEQNRHCCSAMQEEREFIESCETQHQPEPVISVHVPERKAEEEGEDENEERAK